MSLGHTCRAFLFVGELRSWRGIRQEGFDVGVGLQECHGILSHGGNLDGGFQHRPGPVRPPHERWMEVMGWTYGPFLSLQCE